MIRSLAVITALAASACNGASGGGGGSDVDATCVPSAGIYTCLNGTWPVCATGAGPEAPCDDRVHACMGCAQGAGYTCTCMDSGAVTYEDGSAVMAQDGGQWFCVGTEATCQ
ncbi:MAG: hypothetical protein ABSE49_21670 [Polyangiaceae bacterium]|jgi:hypothetical protein